MITRKIIPGLCFFITLTSCFCFFFGTFPKASSEVIQLSNPNSETSEITTVWRCHKCFGTFEKQEDLEQHLKYDHKYR